MSFDSAAHINDRSRMPYFPVGNAVFFIHNTVYKMLVFVVIASIHSVIKHNFAGIGLRLSLHFATVFYCLLDPAATAKRLTKYMQLPALLRST